MRLRSVPGARFGSYSAGKKDGHWVERSGPLDGSWETVEEGPYVNNPRQGHWKERTLHSGFPDIDSEGEGHYVEGKRHGLWIRRGSDYVLETRYEHGEAHGRYVIRYDDGRVGGGSFVNGEKHGYWVEHHGNGNRFEGHYVDGVKQGRGNFYFASGNRYEGVWVDNKIHGPGVFYSKGTRDDGTAWNGCFRGSEDSTLRSGASRAECGFE